MTPLAVRGAVIIEKDGKFLLVQEATHWNYGKWNWPQGKVDEGEEVEAGAVREAKEETGYDVVLSKKVAVIENPFENTAAIHVFLGTIVGGELAVQSGEILQAKWFTPQEIEEIKDNAPGPWVYQTISQLF